MVSSLFRQASGSLPICSRRMSGPCLIPTDAAKVVKLGAPSIRRYCGKGLTCCLILMAVLPAETWGQPACEETSETWSMIQPAFEIPPNLAGDFGTYRSLLQHSDGSKIETPAQWRQVRRQILDRWHSEMGNWPELFPDGQLQVLQSIRRAEEALTQHTVALRWTPQETTTGYLLVPDGQGPFPAVITVYYEPETAIGLGRADRDFAIQLARRGFVTLSLGTTEATKAQTYGLYYPDLDRATVQPLSMLAYAAANAWHALANRGEVDAARIGIMGHSFGGKWAMFASCLFEPFACAVWSDPGIVFDQARPSVNYWEPWYLGYHPRPWRKRGPITSENPARGLYVRLRETGVDLHELHALMAPRPFLVSGGSEDPPERWQALQRTVKVNQLLGFKNRVAMTNRPEHAPNPDSNAVVYAFFQHFLAQ